MSISTKITAPVAVQTIHGDQFVRDEAPTAESGSLGKAMQPCAVGHTPPARAADAFPLTAEESGDFLRIVEATAKINRHYDLFRLLQGEVQRFIPHQILISAWGNFRDSNLKLDVISPIPGVRTGKLNGCGIEHLLKDLFTRWVANGRRNILLDNAATKPITSSICSCPLHLAMLGMGSLLVHGVHDERDEIDSLYVALNPGSIVNGRGSERFFSLVDPLIAQIDVAFRKVAAMKPAAITAAECAAPRSRNLSAREQEIMNWVTDGRTNVQIAEKLCISAFTVKNHMQRIFRLLGATNRTEAAAKHRPQDLQVLTEIAVGDNLRVT
jgi:transcriptional regulator EpsA